MTDEELISKYLTLIKSYTEGEQTAPEFTSRYLDEFKGEESLMSEELYDILDRMFGSADFYSEDPELRGKYGIDDEELLDDAIEAQRRLESLRAELGTDE